MMRSATANFSANAGSLVAKSDRHSGDMKRTADPRAKVREQFVGQGDGGGIVEADDLDRDVHTHLVALTSLLRKSRCWRNGSNVVTPKENPTR